MLAKAPMVSILEEGSREGQPKSFKSVLCHSPFGEPGSPSRIPA